ncbi:hypothetical protein GQ42DRAFT_159948 [Ramicandelaber brevisporus]|nr:hypothetical protein GQ42DRAFT_159948 [Ramicandelaber brevisporus]
MRVAADLLAIAASSILLVTSAASAAGSTSKQTYAQRQSSPGRVFGVPPELQSRYVPGPHGYFTCADGHTEIPFSAVNDDYCDCPGDGSDEPGTSACAAFGARIEQDEKSNALVPTSHRFYCQNAGHVGAFIRSSRVNDGVCDPECCDGSDEYDSGVHCPNTCAEIGERLRRAAAEQAHVQAEGGRVKVQMLEHAANWRAHYLAELKATEKRAAVIDTLTYDLEIIKDREEAAEAASSAQSGATDDTADSNSDASRADALIALRSDMRDVLHHVQQTRRDAVAALVALKRDHNPNFHDMAVLEAVRAATELEKQFMWTGESYGNAAGLNTRLLSDVMVEETEYLELMRGTPHGPPAEPPKAGHNAEAATLVEMHTVANDVYRIRGLAARMHETRDRYVKMLTDLRRDHNVEYNDPAVRRAIVAANALEGRCDPADSALEHRYVILVLDVLDGKATPPEDQLEQNGSTVLPHSGAKKAPWQSGNWDAIRTHGSDVGSDVHHVEDYAPEVKQLLEGTIWSYSALWLRAQLFVTETVDSVAGTALSKLVAPRVVRSYQSLKGAENARDAYSKAMEERWDMDKKLVQLRHLVERDYGSDPAFTLLAAEVRQSPGPAEVEQFLSTAMVNSTGGIPFDTNGCLVGAETDDYSYHICLFDAATQRSKRDGSATRLGTFDKWAQEEDGSLVQIYKDGDYCWDAPHRSIRLTVKCGITTDLHTISEPAKCVYKALLTTPAACSVPPQQSQPSSEKQSSENAANEAHVEKTKIAATVTATAAPAPAEAYRPAHDEL